MAPQLSQQEETLGGYQQGLGVVEEAVEAIGKLVGEECGTGGEAGGVGRGLLGQSLDYGGNEWEEATFGGRLWRVPGKSER